MPIVLFRVSSILDDLRGDLTEPVSFKTECCEPDPPSAPKLSSRTKTSLLLKWNVSILLIFVILFFVYERHAWYFKGGR